MQTKLVEESLPFTKLEMPPEKNENATKTLENENTKYLKKTIRGLGVRKKINTNFLI